MSRVVVWWCACWMAAAALLVTQGCVGPFSPSAPPIAMVIDQKTAVCLMEVRAGFSGGSSSGMGSPTFVEDARGFEHLEFRRYDLKDLRGMFTLHFDPTRKACAP